MANRWKWMLAAAAGTAMLAGPANAGHQWGSYHWDKTNLDVYHTFKNAADWNDPDSPWYAEAISDWSGGSSPLTLTNKGAWSGTSSKKCDPIAGAVLVCSDSYGFRGWLGIASIWANGNHITQGTTKLNDSYFSLAAYNNDAWRDTVTCQELGHDFGLDHQDENFDNANLGTCMDYSNEPAGGGAYGLSNLSPNAHDYEMLNADSMYGSGHSHDGNSGGGCNPRSPKCNGGQTDAFTFREVGQIPRASSESSAEWGRAVSYDAAGRPDTFVLDLGNGRKKITHVFWVPGFKPTREHMH